MRYTLWRVTGEGVVACAAHLRRLGVADAAGQADRPSAAGEALARGARGLSPGVWAVWVDASGGVRFERRSGSRLADGMAVRFVVSPVAGRAGPLEKPPPPGPYAAVRRPGTATLLTTPDGTEILEACSAAVLTWDGASVHRVPTDRPRVRSAAEEAIGASVPLRESVVLAADDAPLLLVNAVAGTCAADVPGRGTFPLRARRLLDEALRASTAWPPGGTGPRSG